MQNKRSFTNVVAAVVGLIVLAGLLAFPFRGTNGESRSLGATDFTGILGESSSAQVRLDLDLTGSVTGLLVDEGGLPTRGVEVELIPLGMTGDQQLYATKRDWTDEQGRYKFPRVDPGAYSVAVLKSGAPDGQHPFASTYYPGVSDEGRADRIYVTAGVPLELHPLWLARIETVALTISVEYEDGTRPAWSTLLFHNPSFPNQAVIGDVAPGVADGAGIVTLPVGFEYDARAKVDCDGRVRIETRESRPIQKLNIRNGHVPAEVKFVIPGPPCTLWFPK